MKERQSDLKGRQNDPVESHNDLRERQDGIEKSHNALKESHDDLEESHNYLKESHNVLKENHNALQKSHDNLKESHTHLESSVSELKMIVEKDEYKNRSNKGGETEESAVIEPMESECEETPVISRPLDGRLIILDNKQIGALMKVCETKVRQGGFGSVFVSKSNVPELDVRVVIKKIICKRDDRIKKLSTLNEKIAARVMHFAVVPLIAYAEKQLEGDKRAYYFLSPYLENESLRGLIARDENCSNINDVMMEYASRIQILFQIATALDYLHTPVPGYRGIILHMDVTTMNIVCDQQFNARLIDFGLAREMNEGKQELSYTQSKIFGTDGYYPTKRYATLTVHEDYYNFGVVIRELLTGKAPFIEHAAYQLRKLGTNSIQKSLQKRIWQDGNKEVSTLLQLSERCLDSKNENLTSSCIVKELKEIVCHNQRTRSEADKCDWCMVNMAVEDGKAPLHRCKMKICVSCMRNSHINPIRCPTCNEEVIPEIGHTFASLLIAGNDLEKPYLAKLFSNDVSKIQNVLASKYPCVIGISDENIITITPSNPGEREKLFPQVSSAFELFQKRKNIETLLIYFSGHHSLETGFTLGCPDDVLLVAKLQEFLIGLCTVWEFKARILIFLDCCQAPKIDLLQAGVKIIQINACRQIELCYTLSRGSLFQIFFVQALTRKIFNKKCFCEEATNSKEVECEDCKMSGDLISVERLLEYISNHMKKLDIGRDPVMYMDGVTWRDASIGYNVDFAVDFSFKFEEQSQKTIDVKLDQEMYCDINELKKHILQKVMCREDMKLKLTDTFADVISLRIHTGSENGKELTTMLQVNAAMNAKREIIASYRSVSHILSGRVALFVQTNSIYRYFDGKDLLKKTGEKKREANLTLRDFDKVYEDICKRPDLKTLHMYLLPVFEAWDNEKEKEDKELRVIFPCADTENGSEFVVLDLSKKSKVSVQCSAKLFMKKQWIIISLLAVLVSFIMFIFM